MDESGNGHGPLREVPGRPPAPRVTRRRWAVWALALGLVSGLTVAGWVGVERVRESAARVH